MFKLLKKVKYFPKLHYHCRSCSESARFKNVLECAPPTEVCTLANGVTVACEYNASPTISVGVWLGAGARQEAQHNNGVAHFVEHMFFKGTTRRFQLQVENQLECMGARIDAYTSREELVLMAKCFSHNIESIICILAEMIMQPLLDEHAIEHEKHVILREIKDYQLDHRAVTMDLLHSTAYQGTPLANTIFGPTSNIERFTQADLNYFLCLNVDPCKIVVAAAGGIDQCSLMPIVNKYFGCLCHDETTCPEPDVCRFTGSEIRVRDDSMNLAHVAIAVEGAGWNSKDKIALSIASEIIGSWDRSQGIGVNNASWLAQASSCENLCHRFKSFNVTHSDTGLWGIYFVTEPLLVEDFLYCLQNQWMNLCTTLTESELSRGKNILMTKILSKLETNEGRCKDIGRQALFNKSRLSLDEVGTLVNTTTDLANIMYGYIYDKCPAIAALGAVEGLPEYTRTRAGMYWLRL